MGLDAYVYCNCFENNRSNAARPEWGVRIDEKTGGIIESTNDLALQLEFDDWLEHRACEHPGAILLHHRLGNISLISLLRNNLSDSSAKLPILLNKVLYSGCHSGDIIHTNDIPSLAEELERLKGIRFPSRTDDAFLRDFETQMCELVDASFRMKKPICF